MKHKPVLLTVTALAAAAVIVLVTLWVLPTRYETDGVTVPERRASDAAAPKAGTFERVWQRSVGGKADGAGQPFQSLSAIGVDQALTKKDDRIQAYDQRTGKPSWHHAQPGRVLDSTQIAKGGVVARFLEKDKDGYDTDTAQLVGLDPATGERLWAKDESWSLESTMPNTTDPQGGVLAFEDGMDRTVGVRAVSGKVAWDVTTDQVEEVGCEGSGPGANNDHKTEPLVVFEMDCDTNGFSSSETKVAVGADSGEIFWTRRTDSRYETTAGVTMFVEGDNDHLQLLAADGSTVYRARTDTCIGCSLLADGNRAVLIHDVPDEPDEFRVVVVDGKTEKPSTFSVKHGQPITRPVVADGRLYFPVQHMDRVYPNPLFPMVVVDLDSGKSTSSPLPIPGPDLPDSLDTGRYQVPILLSASDGQLLVSQVNSIGTSTAKTTVSAYEQLDTNEPVELGGVRPDDWPRACDLLAKVDSLAASDIPDDEQVELESRDVDATNGVDIPERSCSAYVPSVGDIELTVHWVTATEAEAKALLPKPVDTDGYRYHRLGRVLLQVSAGSSAESTDDLIELIGKELPADLAGDG